jgi:hypothetical protein
MLTTVEGVYRNGKVELADLPSDLPEETRVLVTFLPVEQIDLRSHGIDATQAAELRARLVPFADDWESPEMDVYDRYDAAKSSH